MLQKSLDELLSWQDSNLAPIAIASISVVKRDFSVGQGDEAMI